MKSKAKPVKGSARVQKFDRGGTIGALAGLGTLAYLMRDKFGKGKDKSKPSVEDLEAVGGAGRRPRTIEEQIGPRAEEPKGFMAQGKFPSEAGFGTSTGGPEEKTAPVKSTVTKTAPVKSASRVAKLADAVEASDKPAKPTGKAGRDSGYSGVTKQEGSQSFGGASSGSAKDAATAAAKKTSDTVMSRMAAERDAATKKIQAAAETMKGRKVPTAAEQTETATQKIKDAAAKMKAAKEANAKKPSKPYPTEAAAKAKKDKEAKNSGSGFGPKTTITKERKEAAKKSYYSGFKKPLSERGDLGIGKKTGGSVKKYAAGGSVSSASKRADGCAIRGKTRA